MELEGTAASIQSCLLLYTGITFFLASIGKLTQGIDFIGYVLFPHHTLVRTRTKQRMKKRLFDAYGNFLDGEVNGIQLDQRLQSYLGILSHANQYDLSQAIKNAYWVRGK